MTIRKSAFEQFGFVKEQETDKDMMGTCPFCHKPKHFGIKKDSANKQWNCFRCGRSGGFQKLLQEVVKESQEFKPQIAQLADERGLSVETLSAMRVGWFNGIWTVPAFASDGVTVLDIKQFDGDSYVTTSDCTPAIYGLWAMPSEYETIYLCEGAWDTLAMIEMMDDPRAAVIGVPSAGTILRPEIINIFIGKSVYLLYDNDDAGKAGSNKSAAALLPVASELRVIQWPDTAGDGWDVRDVYGKDFKRDAQKAISWLREHSVLVQQEIGIQTPTVIAEHVPYELVYQTFDKYFHLSDSTKYDQKKHDIYDIVFGMVFANRIPGDPVWLYLCAPPGGFKTEPLLALAGGKLIEMHESVTAPALISGMQGGVDPSLIPQLNGRLLVIKDWTIILGLPEHERKEILSILRGGFDGVCGRTFGNGVRRTFKSTFGILAATTPIIEQFTEETSAVGERFLTWRNWISEDFETRYAHIKKALDNTTKEMEIRKETSGISKRVLLSGFKKIPNCSDEFKDRIIKTAQWIAVMRGTVSRDKYRRNVLYKPFSEVATRLSKEILKLLLGISIFKGHGSVRPDTMRIAKSVAWSSVSTRYAETLKAFQTKPLLTAMETEKAVGLPEETMTLVLENMMMLGILEKGEQMKWRVNDKFLTLMKGASL